MTFDVSSLRSVYRWQRLWASAAESSAHSRLVLKAGALGLARYEITSTRAGAPVTYLYEDASKALRKVRTLQKSAASFTITDASGAPVLLPALEAAAGGRG